MSNFMNFQMEELQQLLVTRKRESIIFLLLLISLAGAFFIYRSSSSQRQAMQDLVSVKMAQNKVKKITQVKEVVKEKLDSLAKNAQKQDLSAILETVFKSAEVEYKSEWTAKIKNTPVALQAANIVFQSLQITVDNVELKKMLLLLESLEKSKDLKISELEIACAESKFTINLTVGCIKDKAVA